METTCVYCAVRVKHLNTIQAKFIVHGLTMAAAVIRRLFFTVKTRVRFNAIPCDTSCGQSGVCARLYPSTPVFLVSTIPPVFHTNLHLHVFLTRGKGARILGTFQNTILFRKLGNFGWEIALIA